MGLSILSAKIKKLGFKCELFDTTEIDLGYTDKIQEAATLNMFKPVDFTPYDMNKKEIDLRKSFTDIFNEFNPDLLAFSVLSDERMVASQITTIAKSIDAKILIIWGGKYPTLMPEVVLREYNADYACVGEGIDAFSEFLLAMNNNEELTNIKNIWTKNGNNIIRNEIRDLHKNLDDLPYVDWDIFDKRHFYKAFDGKIYIGGDHMMNWGCPHQCTYCINHVYHKLYKKYFIRRYSVNRIILELKYLKEKYNLEFFKFQDEDFLIRPHRNLLELAEAYKKHVNIPFAMMTNAKFVTEEKVKLLKEMNCVSVSIGIETANPILRKKYLNRPDTTEELIKAFQIFRKYMIRTSSFNMLGIPGETRETFWDTVKLNREANVQFPNTVCVFPFEGTILREIAIEEGLFDPKGEDKNDVYQQNRPVLHLKNLSSEELIEMRRTFVLHIKLPVVYENFIRRSEILDDIGKGLRKKLTEIFQKTVLANDGWFKDDGNQKEYLDNLRNILNS